MGLKIIIVTGLIWRCRGTNCPPAGWFLSKWLRCPYLSVEPILLQLRQTGRPTLLTKQPQQQHKDINDEHDSLLMSSALNILFHQTSFLVSNEWPLYYNLSMVLEFPFSSQSQLEKLIETVTGYVDKSYIDSILILECILQQRSKWSDIFLNMGFPVWFDDYVKTSADLEKAIEQQHRRISSLFKKINHLNGSGGVLGCPVSTLEFDWLLDFDQVIKAILWQDKQEDSEVLLQCPILEALEYLLFKRDYKKEGPLFFTMRQWGKMKLDLNLHREAAGKSTLCFEGDIDHNIVYIVPQQQQQHPTDQIDNQQEHIIAGVPSSPTSTSSSGSSSSSGSGFNSSSHQYICELCDNPVNTTDSAYYHCTFCRQLYLHKGCAELASNSDSVKFQPLKYTTTSVERGRYVLPDQTYVCKSCKEDDSVFSHNCKACLFTNFLKHQLRPVIIRHPLFPSHEQDFFQIQIFSEDLDCAACSRKIGSGISYLNKLSSLQYGFSCVSQSLVPLQQLKHKHFGYEHSLMLKNTPHEELDYYICHVCERERDSEKWYYYCDECEYTAHIYDCIRKYDGDFH